MRVSISLPWPPSKEEGETLKRPRSRPAGSKNKPKPPIIVTRDSVHALKAHAMEVSSGCDVNECLTHFARRNQLGVCILSATGCILDVTLRQPTRSGSTVTLHGRFEIPSLIGSILPPPAPPGVTGLTVYIVGAQGQLVFGGVAGVLVASGPVVIVAALFMNGSFDRLPLEEDEVAAVAPAQSLSRQNSWVDAIDVYGVRQNLLTSTTLPHEVYSWPPGRRL